METIYNLEYLIAQLGRDTFPRLESELAACEQADDERTRAIGCLLRAANLFLQDEGMSLNCLRNFRRSCRSLNGAVMYNIIWLLRRTGCVQEAACETLRYAEDALRLGWANSALEAAGAAMLLDQSGAFEITRNPLQSLRVARIYNWIAAAMARDLAVPAPAETEADTGRRPLRVGLMVPNLVDHVVAYSRLILHFVRYADPEAFALRVYSSENLTARSNPLFPFGVDSAGSDQRAPVLLAELARRGIPFYAAPRDQTPQNVAREMIVQLARDQLDALIVQTGLTCPIDWLVVRLAPVAFKVDIHIGCSTFNPGFDLCLFDNPVNIAREDDVWRDEYGKRLLMRSGADVDGLRAMPRLERKQLGLPRDALVLGVVSNRMGERLSPAYLKIVFELLRRYPQTFFLGIGPSPAERITAQFAQHGLAHRCMFPGSVMQTGPLLKTMDIYLNEFPVGGSESIKEAMACGLPVAALKWSEAHAESAGAWVVGEPPAIMAPDPDAYQALVEQWINDAPARQRAGVALAERARRMYSVKRYVQEVLERVAEAVRS